MTSLHATEGRIILPELLDSAEPDEARENLRDLVRINRWLGGHRVLGWMLRRFVHPGERFTVLDIGAASGDMGRSIRREYPGATVISLDRRTLHLEAADPPRLAADAFRLPFRPASVDFVFCSLFLHHFPDRQIVELLAAFHSIARRALLVIDLERHPIPYYFLPATAWLFRWGRLAVHDGQISVEAAFRPEELLGLARRAGLADVSVRRHRPWFRLSLMAPSGQARWRQSSQPLVLL
ncbi:MAG: methyltransferase domain-containing protein [Bryobacteraceae bacterium]